MPALLPFWPSLVALAQCLGVCAVLLSSLGYQLFGGELPCPLCVLQRAAFLLALVGPVGILRRTLTGPDRITADARDFALALFASLLGLAISSRQILLHIIPPDPGYGPPVLGLHLYTWADIVFLCLIAGSAMGLLGLTPHPRPLPRLLTFPISLLALTIAAVIALATFAMEGFHSLLPPDPARYELFQKAPPAP